MIYKTLHRKLKIEQHTYISYAGAAGMLLHIYGMFTLGKLKSSLLS